MKIKVVSYNVRSGRNDEDTEARSYDFCADVIATISPDIIGLCEMGRHSHGALFPTLKLGCEPHEYLGEKLSMNSCFSRSIVTSDGCPYGNALLTKFPVLSHRTVPIPDPTVKREGGRYESRSVLVCELDVEGGLTVLVSHFGLEAEEKENAVKTVLSIIDEIKTPFLLMGDFNCEPQDSYMAPLFERLCDTAEGKPYPLTWPSNFEKRHRARVKIDYIFTSKGVRTHSLESLETLASDHLPLIAEIEI